MKSPSLGEPAQCSERERKQTFSLSSNFRGVANSKWSKIPVGRILRHYSMFSPPPFQASSATQPPLVQLPCGHTSNL